MDEPQPELRWAPLPPPPKKTGKVWLIVGLVALAVAIVGVVLWLSLSRGDTGVPEATPSPASSTSPSEPPSESPSESASAAPSVDPEPEETPLTSPPPVTAPTLDLFRDHVSGWLDAAPRGLDIIADTRGPDALSVVDTLQEDAQRLLDVQPPESIDQAWGDGISAYAKRLTQLRTAIEDDSGVSGALDSARSSVEELRVLVGL